MLGYHLSFQPILIKFRISTLLLRPEPLPAEEKAVLLSLLPGGRFFPNACLISRLAKNPNKFPGFPCEENCVAAPHTFNLWNLGRKQSPTF